MRGCRSTVNPPSRWRRITLRGRGCCSERGAHPRDAGAFAVSAAHTSTLTMPRPIAIDRLGALLAVLGGLALVLLPFVVFKTNRIVPGDPRSIVDVLPAWGALVCHATLLAVGIVALTVADVRVRLVAALLGVVVTALAAAAAGDALTPIGNKVVRVAPGSGFWLLLLALGLMATDAITRLRPGPGLRVLLLAVFIAICGLAFASGTFDNLSVMREYAVNSDRFARELRQHLLLALGSLTRSE